MAKKGRAALEAFFETGDKPTEAQFTDLIDSFINLVDQSTIDNTIIVNVPVVGSGIGGKVLKRGDALIQIGEYGANDTTISSDDGTFTSGGTLFIANGEISFYFDGNIRISADSLNSFLSLATNTFIDLATASGIDKIRINSQDEISIGIGGKKIGFHGTTPINKPTVTGSRAGNIALGSLLTALNDIGLLVNSTSA